MTRSTPWQGTTLGAEVDLLTGFPFKSEHYTDTCGSIRLLRGDNIVQGTLRWEGAKRWPSSKTADYAVYQLRENDVVLAMDRPWIEAGLKYAAISRFDLPCLLVQRTARLRGGSRLDTRFLRYLIGSPRFTQHIHAITTGTAVPHISGNHIKDFPFRLPPLPEQKAIAHILGTLDDKIELNRRMNQTLEAIAQALFKSWFIDPIQDGPPTGWQELHLEDLCSSIENGGTPKRAEDAYWHGAIPWFKTGELQDGPLITSEESITQEGLDNSSCNLWNEGTILIALYASPTVGRLGIIEIPAAANQACSALSAKEEYGNLFVFYSLLFTRDELQKIAVGAAQQNINQKVLRSHTIVTPPPPHAKRFHDTILPLYQKKAANLRESRTLAQLRDTLLPKLLSGELRIKDAEKFLSSHA